MASAPSSPAHCWEHPAWAALRAHIGTINATHLRDLLRDEDRCGALTAEFDGVVLDYSRQRVTRETMELLFALARDVGLKEKIDAMAAGERINVTENRAVMHMALRVPFDAEEVGGAPQPLNFVVDGRNVVPDVLRVRRSVRDFAQRVRSGAWRGATGKLLVDVVSVGIGGSYLGPEFVYEALRTEPRAVLSSGKLMFFLFLPGSIGDIITCVILLLCVLYVCLYFPYRAIIKLGGGCAFLPTSIRRTLRVRSKG